MPGAKMIFNARYFHIAKLGENLSKHALHKNAAAGLVDYIATRESVVRNFTPEYELMNATDLQRAKIHEFIFDEPEIKQLKEFKEYGENPTAANATRFLSRASSVMAGIDTGEDIPIDGSPATEKQKERIEEFLSAVPELKESMEYKDYLHSPTFNNASEFLSNAFDNSLGSVVDPETLYTMVNYMATRPGVVKDGEHGLFSSDDVTDLEAYKKEVSEHTGNIYSTVVSLRREDADALGFDSQENWKNAVKAKLDVVAKNSGIPLNDLRWCAAMHNTGHHPHIHLMYWSKNPSTQNYLSKQGIEKIKSAFAHEIFRGEFEQIYEVQKDLTQELKKESETLLHNLKEHSAEYAKDPALLQKFSELSSDLSELKGKHQYKYLPKRLKEQVNALVDQIGVIPEIKRLHELYEENNNKMLSIYKESENIPQRKLSEVKSGDNLYFLKNMVIKAAEGISIPKEILPEFDSSPEEQDFESPSPYDIESMMFLNHLEDLSADGDKESAMMLGDIYAEGLGGVSPDADQAVMWYGIAANDYGGETLPLAAYKLSQIMPESNESNNNLANEFAYRAMIGFQKELEQSPNTNLIGDLLQGKYSYASREEYHRQQFEELQKLVPNLEYEPPTVYQDSPENAERLFYLAKLYTEDHLFHPEDSHLTAGNAKDTGKAKSLYQLAFDLGYHPAAYALSRMEENPKQELAWLLKGAEKGNHDCTVKAAQLLKSGENGIQDLALSEILYQKAQSKSQSSENRSEEKTSKGTSENSPRYTSSEKQASALYQKGKELAVDKETASQAFAYFKQSADLGYSWAQYKTAQYIYKGLTDLKRSEAHPYFQLARENFQKEESAGKKNSWRDYVVAGMYQKGLGTPADEKQAYEYYSKALQEFLSSSEMPPWKEYIVGRMFGYGLGTDVNPEESFIYTRKAAEHGHSRAMYDTAGNYLHGKGVDANPTEAQKYYALALKEFIKADKKTPDEWQEYTIGRMFANGLGTQEDPAQAFVYYKQSADNGHTKAAYETAKHYAEGKGIAQNPVLAQQYYQKALEGFLLEVKDSHDPQTEYLLATMYREGLGTEKNPEKAFKHLIKAAESGNGQIQYQAAEYLEKGIGTESNPELAQQYYQKALANFITEDREHPNAWKESVIAKMYEKGIGTEPNPEQAFTYHKKAADNGHTPSAYKVGEAYRNGNGVPVNDTLSQRYFKKAFDGFMEEEKINPDSYLEYRIGRMYQKGLGVEKDTEQAKEWYQKSADKGNDYAKKALENMEKTQNSHEKQSAQQAQSSSALQSLLSLIASQMHQENLQQTQNRRPTIDRKERRKIREKKHEIGLKEDWEQSLE